MSKRLRRELERNQQKIALRPTPPPQFDPSEIIEKFRADAKAAMFATLQAHKRALGTQALDGAAITTALVSFANLLGANRRLVPGEETKFLIEVGIGVIATAAVEAKRECEESRVWIPG